MRKERRKEGLKEEGAKKEGRKNSRQREEGRKEGAVKRDGVNLTREDDTRVKKLCVVSSSGHLELQVQG